MKKKQLTLKELAKVGLHKQRTKLKEYKDNVAEYTAKYQRAKQRLEQAEERLKKVIAGCNPRWFYPERYRGRRRRVIKRQPEPFHSSVEDELPMTAILQMSEQVDK